jgi:phosphoribosyl-AMP cyclohydrolase
MLAHMNDEALARTIESAEAWFYSRSRKALWRKGESSGHSLRVVEMRVDCDQDALWIRAEPQGPGVCHTGRRSCFYRALPLKGRAGPELKLKLRDAGHAFDPGRVYGKHNIKS